MNAHDEPQRDSHPSKPLSPTRPRLLQRHGVFVSVAAMTLALASGSVAAASRALLIGVSGYPNLSESRRLNGPKNDVVLIRRTLESRGFAPEAIRTIADQVPGAALPTRAAILESLDRLAAESAAGDFAFVYFAGHGSQSPVTPGDPHAAEEPDGLHEIFLPYDIGKWTEGTGAVKNAILDHELVDRLQTMRRKGVFVWAVFDACHSATLMRSGDPDVRYRDVSPEVLGVPQARIDAAVRAAQQRSRIHSNKEVPATVARPVESAGTAGGYVAFYAAQTTERTPEERLPAGAPDRKPYGLFGWVLADAIGSVQGVSYRQLAHYVLHRYAAMNRLMPTPQFTGTHLDAPVFGMKAGAIVRQWRVDTRKGVGIRAGQVNQLAAGHVLALMASPTARTEEAVGYLRVTKADIASSRLEPIAHGGKPALAASDIPGGAFARVFRTEVSFTLRVARPTKHSSPHHAAVLAQIDRIEREGVGTVAVRFVDAGAAHDIALQIDDGKLWLLPRGGLKREALRPGDAPGNAIRIMQAEFAHKLSDSLLRIGKALNLLRLADKASRTNAGSGLKVVAVSVIRNGHSVDIDSTSRPTLHSGDHVEVKVRNSGRVPVDLTALYLNSSYGIEPIFPADGADNRLHSGNETTVTVDIFDDTVGLERLMLIAVETRAMNQASDLTWLAQPTLDKLRTVDTETTEVFADAGFGLKADGPRTRSGSASRVPAKIGMTSLVFEVR